MSSEIKEIDMRKILALVLAMVMFSVCIYAAAEVWELDDFVDEFGDQTGAQYIKNIYEFEGTFENSAASDQDLSVRMIVSANEVSFILYRYGDYPVKPSSYENYTMKIKNKSNGTSEIKVTGGYDRISIADKDSARVFGEYTGAGEPIKILIEQNKYGIDKYLFEIPDPAPEEMRALLDTILN